MSKNQENKKILVLAGFSKSKTDLPARVRKLFKGQLFRMMAKFPEQSNFSMRVISGRYGLLDLYDMIEPYDQKISTYGLTWEQVKYFTKVFIDIIEKYNLR